MARCGSLIYLGGLIGSSIDFNYSLISKAFVDSQQVIDDYVQSAISTNPGKGRVAVITGANSGIGFEIAKAIGRAGYQTILACRNQRLGEDALKRIMEETKLDNFELMALDLASFNSIDMFLAEFKQKYHSLHILVNNAGVFPSAYGTTADGIELQFGVNHVGPFYLTTALLELMKQSGGSRIVNTSSFLAYIASRVDTSLVTNKDLYNTGTAYSNSKLAVAIFTTALARKLEGTNVTVNSIHPGYVATNIFRDMSFVTKIQNALFINPTQGALTSIYAALSPEAAILTGKFLVRCQENMDHPSTMRISEQDEVWEFTEELIKQHSFK
ncbi:Retinol dehydrogenase 13 [Linderina pennispora]|nr:Retinol dehydrogenase 13 [Linderina pennispora]